MFQKLKLWWGKRQVMKELEKESNGLDPVKVARLKAVAANWTSAAKGSMLGGQEFGPLSRRESKLLRAAGDIILEHLATHNG